MALQFALPIHYIPEIDILFYLLPKVGVALIIGTLVGAEREYRGKLAGIKTNALICAASAIFTAVSLMMSDYGSANSIPTADVTRIVAQIVSGIGFIGAGAIFKSSSKVQGLTTAAVIWTVSALGILVGYGIFLSTIVITISLILFLSFIAYVEKKFFRNRSSHHSDHHSGNSTMD
ncbi:MgtC/SapB family protein [Pigmentibacter sp. JX0631]|uniref:MgtC/SapB family protein n=1 Tax=Pigmentibacter sp. JX0631 TaxID=2976982 RepID=UPI002469731A|nr:MgtC/SapB family protein [Pigmentibacter sp. JX0631]WGL61067.1 MgtC/SapB family protein [Pigmentibacter sp. JX0631]